MEVTDEDNDQGEPIFRTAVSLEEIKNGLNGAFFVHIQPTCTPPDSNLYVTPLSHSRWQFLLPGATR